jgi:hypothetical protein
MQVLSEPSAPVAAAVAAKAKRPRLAAPPPAAMPLDRLFEEFRFTPKPKPA